MSWLWYLMAVLWVLDALRMRTRLAAIPVLPHSNEPPSPKHRFFAAPDAKLTEETRSAASAWATAQKLELLDLIPSDAPALMLLAIAQFVDPKTYRHNRVAPGFSAGSAFLADEALLRRADTDPATVSEPGKVARRLKRFAGEAADLAVAPSLKADCDSMTSDWGVLSETVGGHSHGVFVLRLLMVALLLTGIVMYPAAGLTALIVSHLQPLIATGGLGLRPRDLWVTVLLRTPMELWEWILMLRSRIRIAAARRKLMDERRPYYEQLLAAGTKRFFEARRPDCPLCGSTDLKVRIRNTDLTQRKPGVFTLEHCRKCGHTFQNPRLTPEGLNFYYSDFYDGLGGNLADAMFRARPGLYIGRARVVEGLVEPKRWLDVGTGQGHFCSAARSAWPDAEFDGLDIADSIDDAVRAGWMNRGYRGFLPDVAPQIRGQYDVVSMFHCLEHTPEPRREIAAAYTALAPGGVVLIEVPNPECPLGRWLGKFWLPWFQPQHLHMPTAKNLEDLLQEQGFDTVRVQVREAHLPVDFFSAIGMFFGVLGPRPHLPWRPRPGWLTRLRFHAVWNLGFPLLIVGLILDAVLGPILQRMGVSNAYRIVARRRESPAAPEHSIVQESAPVSL
jgi:SAM-dependent methyltransferase